MSFKNIITCTDSILIYLTLISPYKIIFCYKAKIIAIFEGVTIKILPQTEGGYIGLNRGNSQKVPVALVKT